MKRIVVLAVCLLLAVPLFSQGAREAQLAADQVTVRMAVMQGPSGFGTVALGRDGGRIDATTVVDVAVYPSPNEVIARLANGELDVAALPTNVAANLHAKGVKVKVAAITGEGMLMFLTTDPTIDELADLANRKISIPGAGGTPDQMTRILTTALGYVRSRCRADSVSPVPRSSHRCSSREGDLAVLPEPFVTMAVGSGKGHELLDVQALWSALTGTGNYPMTVIGVWTSLRGHRRKSLRSGAIKDSVEWVNANPGSGISSNKRSS